MYRGLSIINNKLQSYDFDNGDSCFEFAREIDSDQLLVDYDEFIKTLDLFSHNFTLPLLAYCIFSYTKTLYKQYGHNVDITKVDKYFALNIISTDDTNINKTMTDFVKSFSQFTIKEKNFSPKEYSSEMGVIKNSICTDFPVFVYNSKVSNSEFKTSIPSSMFHKAVTSNISYIYYNLDKFGDYLLNMTVSDGIKLSSLNENIQEKFSQTLLDDYLDFVSKTLSYETYQKEKTRKEKLIKKIYDEDYNGHIGSYIYDFINDICCILQNKEIFKSKTFFLILVSEIKKFTMKEFEALEKEYSDENRMIVHNFAKRYYDKHLLKYEHQFANVNLESYIDWITDNMTERYIEMLVNSYISTSSHHPTYFDNLYKNAKNI